MVKKLINYITVLVIACTLFACKKKKTNRNVQQTFLYKENLNGLGTFTYNYDAQKRLQNMVFASSNELNNASYTYTVNAFDGSGNINDVTVDFISPTRADYKIKNTFNNENKIVTELYTDLATGAVLNTFSYTYNGSNVRIDYKNAMGAILYYDEYSFTADGKNRLKFEQFSPTGVSRSSRVYSNYDNYFSPNYLRPKGCRPGATSVNNPSADVLTNSLGTTANTYTYEYNADGCMTKSTNNNGLINTFEYIKM